MSGGAFDYNQQRISLLAEEIQSLLDRQGKLKDKEELYMSSDFYNNYPEEKYYETYTEEVVKRFEEGINSLKLAYVYSQRIDWYLSGDDGEDSFLRRLEEEISKL